MTIVIQKLPTYLTAEECARQFVNDLLEQKDISISMTELMSPSHLSSIVNISEMFLLSQRSLFLCIVAEIGNLCSEKSFEHVHYLIGFLDELLDLSSQNETCRHLFEKYLDEIAYADLTDHFISYPIVLQIEIMTIIERSSMLVFPMIHENSESDQSKIDLFLQDASKYFHNLSSRLLYRRLVFRLNPSQQASIFRALIIGCVFLPLTCHSAFLNEVYHLLSRQPNMLTVTNIETFLHVLWPTGINQSYSVPRVYLTQLLIVRLFNVPKYFSQILHICFLIHLRVPNVRVNLLDVLEPLCETDEFQDYLDHQQQESVRYDDPSNISAFEPLLQLVRERMKRGFQLKQLCRMKIRSILAKNAQDLLAQIEQLKDLSERNKAYLTYNLELLMNDPNKFVDATQPQNEPIWNSSIPPPPIN